VSGTPRLAGAVIAGGVPDTTQFPGPANAVRWRRTGHLRLTGLPGPAVSGLPVRRPGPGLQRFNMSRRDLFPAGAAGRGRKARIKSVMRGQRFERRMRQCGALGSLLFRASDVYQGGDHEPFMLTAKCPAIPPATGPEHLKKLPSGSRALPTRAIHFANPAMTVF
jgi:hypothetical protein